MALVVAQARVCELGNPWGTSGNLGAAARCWNNLELCVSFSDVKCILKSRKEERGGQ